MLVGYQLINTKDGSVLKEWGGTWGQYPSKPEMFIAPNGDHVHCPSLNTEYSGCMLVEWVMRDPRFYGADDSAHSVQVCQQVHIADVNAYVASELSKSDWKIIRDAEGYKPASESLIAYRKSLRDHGNSLVEEIKALEDSESIIAWQPHDWPVETNP